MSAKDQATHGRSRFLAGLLAAASVMLAGCHGLFFAIVAAPSWGPHVVYVDCHALAVEPPPPTLVSRVDPEYPVHAEWAGIKEGSVKARLTLDRQGSVQKVELIESVPSHVFDREARRVLRMWTYNGDRCDARTVEATLEFKR